MSGDPVPAITEAAATGEVAALFADLRATLGVPVVNLVWRHLATMPGALPWVWGRVKPLYIGGGLAALAEDFRRQMALPPVPRLPAEVLAAVGLSPADRAGIEGVLASYDHSNTINLLALGAFLRRPDGPGRPAAEAIAGASVVERLPKLLTFDEMAPETARLVRALNLLGERDEGRIIASMWRHLSHWPPVLGLAWTILAPFQETGALPQAISENLALAAALQDRLAGGLGTATAPDAEASVQALAAVRTFVEHPIGKMVTICRSLRQSLPATDAS